MSVAHAERLSSSAAPPWGALNGFWSRAREEAAVTAAWFRQASCGLGGHDMVLRFEPGRMSLECVSCGHNTPGWTLQGRT